MRVAEADRAQHRIVIDDRHDQGGGRRQPAVQFGDAAAAGTVGIVRVNVGPQQWLPAPHHVRDGAVRVVGANAVRSHQCLDVAIAFPRRVGAGHANDRAVGNKVDQTEVGQPRDGFARETFNAAAAGGAA
jgi:hypothetical protein